MTNDQALDIVTAVVDEINKDLGGKVLGDPWLTPQPGAMYIGLHVGGGIDLQTKEVNRSLEGTIKWKLVMGLNEMRDLIDKTLEKLA